MADEVTSGEIRVRQFDVVRKGYDRNQVEVFLAQLARQFDVLETEVADASHHEVSVGIDDPEALVREFSTIGNEIGVILESARSAAEGIRERASADADTWTSEAKTQVEESTSDAETQARAARGTAWDEGSSLLAAATEKAAKMVADAETDALRIRAEAEREAIRYTNDAKRASEEVIAAAETEAEGILSTSRAESERVLRAANQSAELAQERARALEDRRSELLVELESTRSSIGELETEFESKRQALEEPEPVAVPEYDDQSHHHTDGGTVKIISGSQVVPLRPVDADSFVAEVAEMHRSAAGEGSQPEDSSRLIADSPQPEASAPLTADSPQSEVRAPLTAVSSQPENSSQLSDGSAQPEEEIPEEGGSRLTADSPLPEDDSSLPEDEAPDIGGQTPEEEQPIADSPQSDEEEPSPAEDTIGSLFAQLREDSAASGKDRATASDAEPAQATAQDGQRTKDSVSDAEVDPRPADDAEPESESLIPVQNAALRTIKRQLVDLQNDALEQLRMDDSWIPDEEFTDRFAEPFSELASAIAEDGDDGGAASVFATDLYDAVSNAVVGAREAGSGDRAIAAATSKVFRTWRSDEAERRVVAVASDLSENV
jgi:DivIVA domain-containing protein